MVEIPAIKIEKLSKNFGHSQAVKNCSINVNPGEIYALIGPNGAGKTTLIKMLVGLLLPSKGEVALSGHNITTDSKEAKKLFGYVSDNPSVYDFLSGREFLELTGTLKNLPQNTLESQITKLLDLFPISSIIDSPMSEYSRGNRQKVAFLAALLGDPQILIIDEPIVGLDPESIKIFGQTLKSFAREGRAVLFATHILSFARDYATKVSVINEGEIIKELPLTPVLDLESLYTQSVKSQ